MVPIVGVRRLCRLRESGVAKVTFGCIFLHPKEHSQRGGGTPRGDRFSAQTWSFSTKLHVYSLETTMREQTLLLSGLISMCLVAAAALMRLVAVIRIFRLQYSRGFSDDNGNSTPDSVMAPSRAVLSSLVFHVLIFLSLATEVPIYACRYDSTLVHPGQGAGFCEIGGPLYALHLSSYLLVFAAFCVIVTLWTEVAVFESTKWTLFMRRSMLILCLCYLLLTGMAVSVCLGLGGVEHFFSSHIFLFFCAYSIAALLLLCLCFLVLGCLLQRRIYRVLVTGSCCSLRVTARVVRLNVVMLACFVCFSIRAFMLASLVEVQEHGEKNRQLGQGWKKWEWDLRFEWAPQLIPCIAMLYLMRNSGVPESDFEAYTMQSDEREDLGSGDAGVGGADRKKVWRDYRSYEAV